MGKAFSRRKARGDGGGAGKNVPTEERKEEDPIRDLSSSSLRSALKKGSIDIGEKSDFPLFSSHNSTAVISASPSPAFTQAPSNQQFDSEKPMMSETSTLQMPGESSTLRKLAKPKGLEIEIPDNPDNSNMLSNFYSSSISIRPLSPQMAAAARAKSAATNSQEVGSKALGEAFTHEATTKSNLYISTMSSNPYTPYTSAYESTKSADNQDVPISPSTGKSKWGVLRTMFRVGAAVTDASLHIGAPLANDDVQRRKLSLEALTTFRSQLTNDAEPRMRLRDWHRSTDRNLCHVYRLCEEFQRFGYGQSELGQHICGVDYLQSRQQVDIDQGQVVSLSPSQRGLKKNERAEKVLDQCGFFHDFNVSVPGFISSIAAQAVFTAETKGQVIFRQNDIVGNVYVLVTGEVSLHTHSDKQLKQLQKEHYNSPRPKDCPKATTLSEARWSSSPKRAKRRGSTASLGSSISLSEISRRASQESFGSQREINESTRFLTVEGFSTFCEKSNLGTCMGTKPSGTVFGEKGAMQEDKKRNATVKCTTDCELLTIIGADYKAALKHVKEKMKYFEDHVPGSKATKGAAHGSTYFSEAKFSKGHYFLTEGVAPQPVIFVIKEGIVEFRRCEDPLVDPASEFRQGPYTSSKTFPEDQYAMRTYARLSDNEIFCSLAAFPIQAYEPFSAVVVSSECTVYFCTSLHKLSLKMLDSVRDRVMCGLEARLLRLKEQLPDAFTLPMDQFQQIKETAFDWSMQEVEKSPKRDSRNSLKFKDSPSDKRRKRQVVQDVLE